MIMHASFFLSENSIAQKRSFLGPSAGIIERNVLVVIRQSLGIIPELHSSLPQPKTEFGILVSGRLEVLVEDAVFPKECRLETEITRTKVFVADLTLASEMSERK